MQKPTVQPLPANPILLFEENYRLIRALLPELMEDQDVSRLSGSESRHLLMSEVLERSRYTTLLSLKMPFDTGLLSLSALFMQVRIYHDARVAEVIAYQDCHRIPAPYQVIRHAPYLVDEKRQVNVLLHELLRYCLRNGYRALTEQDCP